MTQQNVWNKIAKKWNNFRNKPNSEVLEFLKNKKGKVLDLGCGSGRHFIKQKGLEFYGIDFSSELLRFAEEKEYTELKFSDASDIPYPDQFFDHIIFARVLHCIETKEKRTKTLKEIYRTLKKNGQVIITSWGKKSPRVKNKGKEFFLPWTVDDKKVERYTYIYDKEELEKELKSVGFKILKSWEDKNVCFVCGK